MIIRGHSVIRFDTNVSHKIKAKSCTSLHSTQTNYRSQCHGISQRLEALMDSVRRLTEDQFSCDCLAGCSGGGLNHRLGEGLVMMLLLFALPKHLLLVPVWKVLNLVRPLPFLMHLFFSTGETPGHSISSTFLKLGSKTHFIAIC